MKRWPSIALWTGIATLGLVAVIGLWVWTSDLGFLKPRIESLVTDKTGRDLRIGTLSIDVGSRSTVIAEDLSYENVAWADKGDMVSMQRIEVQFDLFSLISGPIVLRLVDIDGARIHLAARTDGPPNWFIDSGQPAPAETDDEAGLDILLGEVFVDDVDLVFESPDRTGPLNLRLDSFTQRHRADDFLELVISGSIGDRTIGVEGEIGSWQALQSGADVRYALQGQLDTLSVESAGFIDSFAEPRRPYMTFKAAGPDINDLFDLLRIDAEGSGDINLTGSLVANDAEPLALGIEGNVGQMEILASGTVVDLQSFERIEFEVETSGPDLSRITRLFGIQGIREAPFSLQLDAERDGKRLVVDRAMLALANAEFTFAAEIPNFPSADDADIELHIAGPDIERFREVLNLPGAATGAFTLQGDVKTSADGIEFANLVVETSLGQLEARGTLGEEAGLIGTELTFDMQSPSLSRLAGSYGLPRLPDAPVEISGTASLEEDGVRTRGPLVLRVRDVTATVDGLLRTESGLYGSRLTYGLDGPDLAELVGAFTDASWVPGLPYRFNGLLDIQEDGFGFRDVVGTLGESDVAIDGLLRPVSDLGGTRFRIVANGPEIHDVIPDSVDLDLRPGPYVLSGALQFTDESVELQDIRLERELGEVELDLSIGRAERRIDFVLDADGRDVRSILSSFEGVEAESGPFSIDTRGTFFEKRLTLDDLDVVIGDATLDASGDLDLAETARSTRFRFDLAVPSLAKLGTFRGYRMRPQALTVAATVESGGGTVTVNDVIARLDDSNIDGSLRLEVRDVPRVEIEIASNSLMLLSPLEEQEAPSDPTPEFDDGRIIPDAPLPLQALSSLDASISVAIDDLVREGQHFRDVKLQVSLEDGTLDISRLGFFAPSGRLDGRARLVPGEETATLNVEISADDFALGLSPANVNLDMTGDVQVNLAATGTNLRELAASADGIVLIDTRGGQIANNRTLQALYGDMLEQIVSVINPFYTADPITRFACIILPLELDDGELVSTPNVLILTDKLRIVSDVDIDLGSETLDLSFRTTPRRGVVISAGELLNPFVKVVGTLAEPRLAVDEQGILVTGGAAVATGGLSILARAAWDRLNRSSDPCGDVSKEAIELLGGRFADFSVEALN